MVFLFLQFRSSGQSYAEKWAITPDTEKLYEDMGHDIKYYEMQGQIMGIYIDSENGLLYGTADSRSFDGKATGY